MATVNQRATLEDLLRTKGKAELIGGRIVEYMATGMRPNEVAGNIFLSLKSYVRVQSKGKAFTDTLGYAVPELPHSAAPGSAYRLIRANLVGPHFPGAFSAALRAASSMR